MKTPLIKLFGLFLLLMSGTAHAADKVGHDWQINFYDAATEIMERTAWFHEWVLLPIITFITIFVFILMVLLVVKFREKKNPVPSKTTHNTPLEIAWTLIPFAILIAILIPSVKLLTFQDVEPKADVTIKATGHKWHWRYEYPVEGIEEYEAYMLCQPTDEENTGFGKEGTGFDQKCVDDLKAKNRPHKLATDYPVVVPVNKNVRLLLTSADVIHAWTIPAFGVKKDAVPGRMNSLWFNAREEGVYYGQCSELCGTDHAFMPIEVHVVPEEAYKRWVDMMKDGDTDLANEVLFAYKKARENGTLIADAMPEMKDTQTQDTDGNFAVLETNTTEDAQNADSDLQTNNNGAN